MQKKFPKICVCAIFVVPLQANCEESMNIIAHIGEYFLLMGKTFRWPDRQRMFDGETGSGEYPNYAYRQRLHGGYYDDADKAEHL